MKILAIITFTQEICWLQQTKKTFETNPENSLITKKLSNEIKISIPPESTEVTESTATTSIMCSRSMPQIEYELVDPDYKIIPFGLIPLEGLE